MSEDDAPKHHTSTKEAGSPQTDRKDKELHTIVKTSDHVTGDSGHTVNGENVSNASPKPVSTNSESINGVSEEHDRPRSAEEETANRLSTLQIRAPSVPVKTDEHPEGATSHKVSEWSHQALAPPKEDGGEQQEEEWQDMPAIAQYDLYDDDGKLVARKVKEEDPEANAYTGLGGAGKGYTRVQHDEDADSTSSMEDNTSYLFKQQNSTNPAEDDEELRDTMAQMQATKDLLTEGQRIAYVGVTRVTMAEMVGEMENLETTKGTKKDRELVVEAYKMWSQKMMVRLYGHMEISSSEQVMVEQLAEHGVQSSDLTPALMQNAKVKNPMAEEQEEKHSAHSSTSTLPQTNGSRPTSEIVGDRSASPAPPAYKEHLDDDMPEVKTPSQLPKSRNLDIDIRWTVLCDLFLVLIADSVYDARSRTLLERVGLALKVPWIDICRFEKRVTDAIEMQEAANKETWDEAEHMETRRKQSLKKKYAMMGLATVGGSLVIGLSAGLLAPLIGAGLAAGFTTIGVAGTGTFLAGAGGTALITSGAVLTGGTIGVRASKRRMGAVQTFEYRPLHNNKRVNLIVTVSGWMNGKVDDVRLPFSTVNPIMGDMYSVLWEPEMLRSTGDTINILATEALTQSIQQILGSTILVALMASLQLPIVLTKLSYLIDNPWTVSCQRANSAGLILADSLIDRNLGLRPITLVGFSLGARVIYYALKELANRGAWGLIQNVYLFGSPVVANKDDYLRARMIVSGRFVNGYASNDWILGYLFRATSGGIMRVAGLAPVEGIAGLENIDVTELVNGHMAYRAAMPKLLRKVGWELDSDEFTEIEDPDPENHEARHRELIKEIDDARKQAEQKPEKRRFGLFKRGKLAEKKGWEMYDDNKREPGTPEHRNSEDNNNRNVLFDIDAIRKELASEHMDVKQLESTMPPMKLEMNGSSPGSSDIQQKPYSNLRATKSHDGTIPSQPVPESFDKMEKHTENLFNKGYDEYDEYDDSEVSHPQEPTLSFGTPLKDQAAPTQPDLNQAARTPPPHLAEGASQPIPSHDETNPPQRPTLQSANTTPIPTTNFDLGRNAWAEEEDEDFGKEKNVQLSFG